MFALYPAEFTALCDKKEEKVCIFAIFFVPLCPILNISIFMENFKKYLGVVLLLLGVVFLVIYRCALPYNSLLITAMVCEVAGILAYIFINRKA